MPAVGRVEGGSLSTHDLSPITASSRQADNAGLSAPAAPSGARPRNDPLQEAALTGASRDRWPLSCIGDGRLT